MDKEDVYRTVDALYRIHEDMFHVEDVIRRFAQASTKTAVIRANATVGAIVVGFLSLLPILISVTDFKLVSVPAGITCVLIIGLGVVLFYQVHSSKATLSELKSIAGGSEAVPLVEREEYLFAVVAAWGTRSRVIDEILIELDGQIAQAAAEKRDTLGAKRLRYEEIKRDCTRWIRWAVERCEQQVKEGALSAEDLADLRDWAAPFITQPADGQHGERGSNP